MRRQKRYLLVVLEEQMAQSENNEKEQLAKYLFKIDVKQLISKFRKINSACETTVTSTQADESKMVTKDIVTSLKSMDHSEITKFDLILLKALRFAVRDITERSSTNESDTSSESSTQSAIQTAIRGRPGKLWRPLLSGRGRFRKSEWYGSHSNENGTK